MPIEFYKYQGTGNDFILINNFEPFFDKENKALIAQMCDRKFGIGADGLMVIERSEKADFDLYFFNPDASVSFCGNGSRCAVQMVKDLGLSRKENISFSAFDGLHTAVQQQSNISISMRDVPEIKKDPNGFFVNTGAPHVVVLKEKVDATDVMSEGRRIRYDSGYAPVGTNVNFMEELADGIRIRTYEKGVEDETLSCGTGVTACALTYAHLHPMAGKVKVYTRGGQLEVSFEKREKGFVQVRLAGPASFVFKGEYHG